MKRILLTQGQSALVDSDDYDWLLRRRWHAQWRRYGYVARGVDATGRVMTMSAVIMQPSSGLEVDHINGDTLDNQRANLRVVTSSQNHMNRGGWHRSSSRFKGVSWNTRREKWYVHIKPAGQKVRYLGSFHCEEDAARAYDAAAKKFHGEFAFLNFQEENA